MERKILSSLLYSREAFETLEPFLYPEDLSDQGGVLYEQINQFYNTDPDAQAVDKEILNARIQRDILNMLIVWLLLLILLKRSVNRT